MTLASDEAASRQDTTEAPPRTGADEERTAGAYLYRTREALQRRGVNPRVVAEARAPSLPEEWKWGLLTGLEEAVELLEGRDVDVLALPEGSVFYPEEPVLSISGKYLEFAELETAIRGVLAQPSGVATRAARLKRAAAERPIYLMETSAVHPAVAPILERAAYVGGCDAVATPQGAALARVPAVAFAGPELSVILGEPEAWTAFDQVLPPEAPRLVTVGTLQDERAGAIAVAEALGERLTAIRLPVPRSRRAEVGKLVSEVRWELDARGHTGVRIVVAGDLDEEALAAAAPHADAFGVGRSVTRAPDVPFSLDLVEVDGRPAAPRGVLSGRKHLWRCERCGNRGIAPAGTRLGACPRCGGRVGGLLQEVLRFGERLSPAASPQAARSRALREAAEAGA